jgi:spore coat protein CotH
VVDQRFRGLKRMTLNNCNEDWSYIVERTDYLLFRSAGVPAPRANNATVSVNGELYGLYANVEAEDKTFLSRWFADNDGNLYESTGPDFEPGRDDDFELETNELANDRTNLQALITAIDTSTPDTFVDDVGAYLDIDAFLTFAALEGITNQWDGYCYGLWGRNNFRIYDDPTTGRFYFMPWGVDDALAGLGGEDWLSIYASEGIILTRCLESPACRDSFDTRVAEMVDLFESLDLPALAETYTAQVTEDAYADPRREFDEGNFDYTSELVHSFLVERPDVVRAELP